MSGYRLILASASPRREELLRQLGFPFTVVPSQVSEELAPGPPVEAALDLALAKARAVASLIAPEDSTLEPSGPVVVLGADTVVVLDRTGFGKPSGAAHARQMLRALRGRTHEVITAVAMVEAPSGREARAAQVSRVTMAEYSEEEIDAYLATGEPYDKAGAYAVQGQGGRLVAQVEGCYTNVVGLPLTTTRRLLSGWGLR